MNALQAMQDAQWRHDNRLPPDDGEALDLARAEWIENAVEQLVDRRNDVKFKRRLYAAQGITFKYFAAEVEQYAIASACKSPCAIGEMILGSLFGDRSLARDGAIDLMAVADPREQVRIIARRLLRPLADDALIAQAEDGEL